MNKRPKTNVKFTILHIKEAQCSNNPCTKLCIYIARTSDIRVPVVKAAIYNPKGGKTKEEIRSLLYKQYVKELTLRETNIKIGDIL